MMTSTMRSFIPGAHHTAPDSYIVGNENGKKCLKCKSSSYAEGRTNNMPPQMKRAAMMGLALSASLCFVVFQQQQSNYLTSKNPTPPRFECSLVWLRIPKTASTTTAYQFVAPMAQAAEFTNTEIGYMHHECWWLCSILGRRKTITSKSTICATKCRDRSTMLPHDKSDKSECSSML